jgi:hypothetical protein
VGRKSGPGSSSLSRRQFGKRVALAAGAGAVSCAGVQVAGSDVDGYADRLEQSDPDLHKLSAEGRVRFESMWQSVLRKHADFSEEQRTRMRKIIVDNVTLLESVYAVGLENGDAPATILLLKDQSTAPRRARTGAAPARRKPAVPRI